MKLIGTEMRSQGGTTKIKILVPGPRDTMGWRMKLGCKCEREDLWGRKEKSGHLLFLWIPNFSPYFSRDRTRHRTRNHMVAGGELGAERSLFKAL